MDVGICGDVIMIVEDNERIPNYWAVKRDGCRRQWNAENGIQLFACEEWPGSRKCFWVRPLVDLGTRFRESLARLILSTRLYPADWGEPRQ